MRYLRRYKDVYSILESLKKIASLPVKRMFCSFSGSIDHPLDAINKKIEYLEGLQQKVKEGFRQGLSPREIQWKLLGRSDWMDFFTLGQISKKNLINAFLKNPPLLP